MAEQLRIFLQAVMFFTRLPVPSQANWSPDYLNKASQYFSLVGWIVGGVAAGVFLLSQMLFPVEVAVALSMVASILLTGAFHEDGLADACDGFGGGWDRDQILTIMKDSRLGTYGACGLVLGLALKWLCLSRLNPTLIAPALFVAHPFSRLASTALIRFGSYARKDLESKAKPLAVEMNGFQFLVAAVFGLAPFLMYPSPWIWASLAPVLLITLYLKHYFEKWIGGYTGDCLGAVQQVTELITYLTLLGFSWKSI